MARAEQIKALLKCHIEQDDERFISVALQVAAYEAKRGHGKLAKELRALIDNAKSFVNRNSLPIPIVRPKSDLSALISVCYPQIRLSDMILDDTTLNQLKRTIKEHRHLSKIYAHGLSARRKLLLLGKPGTGKTMTASALAGELRLPLFEIRLEGVITKFMGETAAKLRLVFDAINETRGVYLFDEFDSIGSKRITTNDVGEIRRVLNSFLQFIEQDKSESLILAATNHPEILDYALFRRFDDVIKYSLPDQSEITRTLKTKLAPYNKSGIEWKQLSEVASGLSYAEISRACEEAAKDMIIHDREHISSDEIIKCIGERKSFFKNE